MRIRKFLHSHFNPRSYKRSDLSIMAFTVFTHLFQSTLLQEERLLFSVMIPLINCISIHAPTRGATPLSGKLRFVYIISIHAPTRGATLSDIKELVELENFNPRSYKRSDHKLLRHTPKNRQFQSTLLQEERLFVLYKSLKHLKFQSTLLQEERPFF